MAEQDLTSEEGVLEDDNPNETAEEKETPQEKTLEPEVDYKERYKVSQQEAIRLSKKVKEYQDKAKEVTPDLDKVIDQKVRDKIAPLEAQAAKDAVDKFLRDNPEASDYLEKINEQFSDMPGKNISEKLENAFLIVKKDAAKETGKKELAFTLYQQGMASASGGGATSVHSRDEFPSLSNEEKLIAQRLGISEEAFAKRKLENTKLRT
jgi:phage I-like protein